MNVIAGALRELYGLFVDDLAVALSILAWIALFAAFGRTIDGDLRGVVLFVGFAGIVLIDVARASQSR